MIRKCEEENFVLLCLLWEIFGISISFNEFNSFACFKISLWAFVFQEIQDKNDEDEGKYYSSFHSPPYVRQ